MRSDLSSRECGPRDPLNQERAVSLRFNPAADRTSVEEAVRIDLMRDFAALAPEIGDSRAECVAAGEVDADMGGTRVRTSVGSIASVSWLIDGGQTLQSWANASAGSAFPKFR